MKKTLFIALLALLVLSGCVEQKQAEEPTAPQPFCDDLTQLNQNFKIEGLTIESCLPLDINGDNFDEMAIYQVDHMEFYENGVVSVYKLDDQYQWQEIFKKMYDVDSQMTLQKGDLDADSYEELLINQYMGATGAALSYELYYWHNGTLEAAQSDKAYENTAQYLEGDETWGSYFDAVINKSYLIEKFSTYTDEDSHCCPSGRHISVYYELENGELYEAKVETENIFEEE